MSIQFATPNRQTEFRTSQFFSVFSSQRCRSPGDPISGIIIREAAGTRNTSLLVIISGFQLL
jgi:hypothetical protein